MAMTLRRVDSLIHIVAVPSEWTLLRSEVAPMDVHVVLNERPKSLASECGLEKNYFEIFNHDF